MISALSLGGNSGRLISCCFQYFMIWALSLGENRVVLLVVVVVAVVFSTSWFRHYPSGEIRVAFVVVVVIIIFSTKRVQRYPLGEIRVALLAVFAICCWWWCF